MPNNLKLDKITNIKLLHNYDENLMSPYKIITNKIKTNLNNIGEIEFLKFRDILYDLLIYNIDITTCIWDILSTLANENKINKNNISTILIFTFRFFQYYNNNYRPIYHLENYFLHIAKIIHGF
jgi:hypothetical protein